MQLTPEEMAGVAYFRQEHCTTCHSTGEGGSKIGPDLAAITVHRNAGWMIQHFRNPSTVRPGSSMPPIQLSQAELNELAAFLLKLNPANATALGHAPDFALQGALVYQKNGCNDCHQVNGVGGAVGPPLNGIGKRRSRGWVEVHFADPPKFSPGSVMPPYQFSRKDLEDLVDYLFALPD
jgi:ubiquinol-cytochrome c reductase cytochrome b subunit